MTSSATLTSLAMLKAISAQAVSPIQDLILEIFLIFQEALILRTFLTRFLAADLVILASIGAEENLGALICFTN